MHKSWFIGAVLAVVVGLGVLPGCSSRPKTPPLPAMEGSSSPRVLWQARVAASGHFDFTPAADESAVYAAGADGRVSKLDMTTGRELWRSDTRARLSAGVGSGAGLVVVGSIEGELVALGADGKPAWKVRLSSEIAGPPLVAGDTIVVRTADNRAFGLEAQDGKRRWMYQRAAPALTVQTSAGSAASAGLVYTGFPGGKLVALSLANGGLRWEGTVSLPKGATELERVSDIVGFPWLAEREVCAVAYQGRVACFDTNTGTSLWTKEVASFAGLNGDARYVFVSDEKGAVIALDRSTGNSMWRQDKLVGRTSSAPLALDRVVAVGDREGYVHLLSRETGSLIGRVATDGSPIGASPVATRGGTFVVQTRAGGVFAIAP